MVQYPTAYVPHELTLSKLGRGGISGVPESMSLGLRHYTNVYICQASWGTRAMCRRQFFSVYGFVSGNRVASNLFSKGRYASLYFYMCINQEDNELEVLEIIHHYVEILDHRKDFENQPVSEELHNGERSGGVLEKCIEKPVFSGTIGELKGVQTIGIYTSLLSGPNRDEIGNYSQLRNLYLYQHCITGSISRSIGELQKLESVLLWLNSLVGGIPEEIKSNSAGLFGTRFLPTHPRSEDTLCILRNYRVLPELGNWFQLNYSFLRFTIIFTVSVYNFCAAVLKWS
ncbi:hypothetical protein LXL04_020331 [Taraxacum kok-saghyz]